MKKICVVIVMMVMSFMLASCDFSQYGELYDDEEKMMATGDSYSFLGKVEINDHIEFDRFSGIYTLKSMSVDGSLTIELNMDISSGQFKVILVSDDDGIIELQDGTQTLTLLDDRARLRIVGADAKGSLSFQIDVTA